jgi:hypothetical protein
LSHALTAANAGSVKKNKMFGHENIFLSTHVITTLNNNMSKCTMKGGRRHRKGGKTRKAKGSRRRRH